MPRTKHDLYEPHGICILLYGRDHSLLDTRRLVLERAGYAVRVAESAAEARQMIVSVSPALFILCHSLRLEDCEHVLAASHQLRPQMHTLVLTAFRPSCPEEQAEAVVDATRGPVALVSAVTRVLYGSDAS